MTTAIEQAAVKYEQKLKRHLAKGEREMVTLRNVITKAPDITPEIARKLEVEVAKLERYLQIGRHAVQSLNRLPPDPAGRLMLLRYAFDLLDRAAED